MLHILDHVQMGNKRRLSRAVKGLKLAAWRDESGSFLLFVGWSHFVQRWLAHGLRKRLREDLCMGQERVTTQS